MSISSGSKILASDVTGHINNKNNPHGITVESIGAATSSHTHSEYVTKEYVDSAIANSKPIYRSWSGSMSENKNSSGYSYFSLPDSRVPTRVTFYFNETPNVIYNSSNKWASTDPISGQTKYVSPGGSFTINQSRCTWRMGVASDGRPYSYTASSVGGSTCYWNIALTFEY